MNTHYAPHTVPSVARDLQLINDTLFPARTWRVSRRIRVVGVVSLGALVVAGLFLYQVQAQVMAPLSARNNITSSPTGKVYLSAQVAAAGAAAAPAPKTPTIEVNIANNGLVLLRGARVTDITGTVIQVDMKWGANDFAWTVNTRSNTKFINSKGENQTLNDIQVGDYVIVTGMLARGADQPTIEADFVRE